MHVLHIMASGARGGGADHLLGLLPALQAQGVTCSATVGDDGPLAEALAARQVSVSTLDMMRSRANLRATLALAKLVRQKRPALVHYHGTRAAFFGAAVQLSTRAPSLYTAHGLAYRKESALGRRMLFMSAELAACRQAREVISVSNTDLHDLQRRRILSATRGVHIPNAVDPHRFGQVTRAQARAALDIPQNVFLVGTTSRLVRQKAVGDLMSAVEMCHDIRLLVIGDGPERATLRQHPLVESGRAILLGSRGDVPRLLPALDVFALSSLWEGEPIALLEAMASGLPCVATATAGATEILRPHDAGVLVDIGDVRRFAEALCALQADPVRRQQLAAHARAAVAHRTYSAQAQHVRAVYESVLQDGQAQDPYPAG